MMPRTSADKVVFKGEDIKWIWYITEANIYVIGKDNLHDYYARPENHLVFEVKFI